MDVEMVVKELILEQKIANLTVEKCDQCYGKGFLEWHSQGWKMQCSKCHGAGIYIIKNEKWKELIGIVS